MSDTVRVAMPHDVAMESALIGGCLAHGTELSSQVCDEVGESDFYINANKIIFSCVKSLVKDGSVVNLNTVAAEVDRLPGRLEGIGGIEALRILQSDAPMANGMVLQARYLKTFTLRRKMILSAQSIAKNAADLQVSPTSLIQKAEKSILAITDSQTNAEGGLNADSFFAGALADAIEAKRLGRRYRGIPTGLVSWDDAVSGLVPELMYLICGRPSSGKTAAIISMAINLLKSNVPVIYFSLEMSATPLAGRFYSSWASIDGRKIGTSMITNEELDALAVANREMRNLPLRIHADPTITASLISSLVRQYVEECRPKYEVRPVVMVDFLQIVAPAEGTSNRNESAVLKDIAYGVRNAAVKNKCACVALCQINRDSEKSTKKRHLTMSDIDGSGRIEQAADTITMLENPIVSSVHEEEGFEVVEDLMIPVPWRVVKNRYGHSPIEVKMGFDRRFGTYRDLSEEDGGW